MPQEANKLLLWNKKARHRHQPDKAGELAKVAPEGESQCKKPPTGEGQAAFGILWASERPPVFKIRLLIELINTFRLCGASCSNPAPSGFDQEHRAPFRKHLPLVSPEPGHVA